MHAIGLRLYMSERQCSFVLSLSKVNAMLNSNRSNITLFTYCVSNVFQR